MTLERALTLVSSSLARGLPLRLAFANAHTVNTAYAQPAFREALAGFLVLADGSGVDIAMRLLRGRGFAANLNGTDFIPALLAHCETPLKVTLLGAKPGVADRAAGWLNQSFPRHRFSVLSDGYFKEEALPRLLGRLAAAPPDLLLVAFGNPAQEMFIARHITPAHATVATGVGALFDFFAGRVRRAPLWMRRLRLEWLFRLMLEPARLWRRYVFGNPLFVARVVRQWLSQRR